jgi:uncharacterized repeat protein (TIGR03847 family)
VQPQVFDYDQPDRFVAGTVGEPGQRTFYLQARAGGRLTSVVLEKQQVAALAERIDQVLDEVLRASGGTAAPAVAPAALDDRNPLDLPLEEEFRVGTMGLAWDGAAGALIVEAHAIVPEEEGEPGEGEPADVADLGGHPATADDGDDDGADDAGDAEDTDEVDDAGTGDPRSDVLRVRLSPAQARAFAKRAAAVVGAGRPACPFCGLPLDPSGHICPRRNGYLRR